MHRLSNNMAGKKSVNLALGQHKDRITQDSFRIGQQACSATEALPYANWPASLRLLERLAKGRNKRQSNDSRMSLVAMFKHRRVPEPQVYTVCCVD